MNNDKKQELKNKIDELVKEKLAKFRSKIQIRYSVSCWMLPYETVYGRISS